MPFSPNPFLPLHNIQRRFDFLGTQTRYFTGKHIRFGRSFTSQGARCSPHSCDEQKAVTSPRRCIFNAPAPNGNRVEMCLKSRLILESPAQAVTCSVWAGPFPGIDLILPPQIGGSHIQKFAVSRLTVQMDSRCFLQK